MNHEFTHEDGFQPEDAVDQDGQSLEAVVSTDEMLLRQMDEMFKQCAELAKNPEVNDVVQSLATLAVLNIRSVRTVLEKVDDGTNSPANIDELLAYARGLEVNRVKFLNEIHPNVVSDEGDDYEHDDFDSHFDNDDDEGDDDDEHDDPKANYMVAENAFVEIREHLLEECEDGESALSHVIAYYQFSLETDLQRFYNISREQHENDPSTKRKEQLKKIGNHALDVAKVTVGSLVGSLAAIAIAKKFKLF